MDLKTIATIFTIASLLISGFYVVVKDAQTQRREGDARLNMRIDRIEERLWKLNTPDVDIEPHP